MRKRSEYLQAARDKLSRSGWLKHMLARNSRGWAVEPESPEATSFCARGVIVNVIGGDDISLNYVEAPLDEVCRTNNPYLSSVPGWEIVGFNNHPDTTKADMLAAFDKAIVNARAYEDCFGESQTS